MAKLIPKTEMNILNDENEDSMDSSQKSNLEEEDQPVTLQLAPEEPEQKNLDPSNGFPGLHQEMENIKSEFLKLQAMLRPNGSSPEQKKPESAVELANAESSAQKILEKAHTRYEAIVAEATNQEMEILEAYHKKGMDITSSALNKHDKIISDAKEKADQTVSLAAKQATQLIADAKMKASQILQDAEEKRNATLANLNQEQESISQNLNAVAEQQLQEKRKEIESQAQLILMKAKEDTELLLEEGRRFVESERQKIENEIAVKQALFEEEVTKKKLAMEQELRIAEADLYKNFLEKSRDEIVTLGKKFEHTLLKTSRNAFPPEFIALATACFARVFNVEPPAPKALARPKKIVKIQKPSQDATILVAIIALTVALASIILYKKQNLIQSWMRGKPAVVSSQKRGSSNQNRVKQNVRVEKSLAYEPILIQGKSTHQNRPQERAQERYRPPQTKTFHRSYTDNVLFTMSYTATEWNARYQQKWKKNLSQFITKDLRLKSSAAQQVLGIESKLIKDLRAIGQKITLQSKDADIRRMRSLETQAQTKLLSILGSRHAYERFWDFKTKHFKQHSLVK